MRGLLILTLLAACGSTDNTHYVVVKVDWPAAVHGVTSLSITLGNAGTTRMDARALAGKPSPVEFSVSAPDRTGDLAITVDATDAEQTVVGHGTATAKLTDDSVTVILDTTDFVVNTDVAGDQQPSDNGDAGGLQLAARADQWTVAFRSCPTTTSASCNMFGRTFDQTGEPIETVAAAGTNEFEVSTMSSSNLSNPAIAAGAANTLVVWDYLSPDNTNISGIACRSFDPNGLPAGEQTTTTISSDFTITAAVAALPTGNFVATWTVLPVTSGDPQTIHGSIIKPDCTPLLGAPFVVAAPGTDVDRSVVAVNGDAVLYAWIVGTSGGDLRVRPGTPTAAPSPTDAPLLTKTAHESVSYARLAPAPGGGFMLAVRWASTDAPTAAGRIELYQLGPTGAITSGPLVITDKTTSSTDDNEAIGLTTRAADGVSLVTWHACADDGDGAMCGVFGQFAAAGALVGDRITIPTTTAGDQILPSVVALPKSFAAVWSDASATVPDVSGTAVRARILYPPGYPPAASSSAR